MTSPTDSGRVLDHKSQSQMAVGEEDSKPVGLEKHLEHVDHVQDALVYDDAEHEPELHIRTYIGRPTPKPSCAKLGWYRNPLCGKIRLLTLLS